MHLAGRGVAGQGRHGARTVKARPHRLPFPPTAGPVEETRRIAGLVLAVRRPLGAGDRVHPHHPLVLVGQDVAVRHHRPGERVSVEAHDGGAADKGIMPVAHLKIRRVGETRHGGNLVRVDVKVEGVRIGARQRNLVQRARCERVEVTGRADVLEVVNSQPGGKGKRD